MKSMKSALITGANRGLGLEFAKQLGKLGYQIFATSRQVQIPTGMSNYGTAAQPQTHTIELHQIAKVIPLDVADSKSISELPNHIKQPIDLLINNSGVLLKDNLPNINQDSLLQQFTVNSIGPILIAQSLLPLLEQSSDPKIVNITSRMGSIQDNTSGGRYGYRASKAALNMMTKSFSLDKPAITTILLHPGYIKTDMTQQQGDMEADEAVKRMIKVISNVSKNESGKFFHRDGQELPW
eukprot:NODE_939_length_2999_cov_0.589310.p1 type:complete len:239 gc:universal NODE_939_length_2999_cov_0.589310:1942-2658(+)